MHRDDVVDVHESDERERERLLGHQRDRQRERQHMQVGRRQLVADPETAHLLVLAQVVGIDRPVVQGVGRVGQGLAGQETARPQRRS